MTIALLRLGQRLVKYEDFICAYVIKIEKNCEKNWMIEVETSTGRYPVYFGTYFECYRELDHIDIICHEKNQERTINIALLNEDQQDE